MAAIVKKYLTTVLFLALAACSPKLASHPTGTPVTSKLTVPTIQSQMASNQSPSAPVSTALPSITPTRTFDNIVERVYDPGEWKLLYDKDTIWKIELDPAGRMWVWLSRGEVGFFDGNRWVLFSTKDYLLPDIPYDMAIAPDGAVWLTGRHAISRYEHGAWEIFPMPDISETAFPRMTIDASGTVWVNMLSCYDCGNLLKKFDGKNWSELRLWTTERWLDVPQALFTPDGALWVADDGGEIGRYDGKNWKNYSEMDLWSTDDYAQTMRIAADSKGNIFGVYSGQSWLAKIDNDGNISKIPFDSSKLEFDPVQLRLFVDLQETVWVNACLRNKQGDCLAYYKNSQWVSFTNLPFGQVHDIKELSDGTLLFATSQGLYQFKSKK